MSLNNLQNNYMEPVPTVESTVKAIMYDLIPAIKEKVMNVDPSMVIIAQNMN